MKIDEIVDEYFLNIFEKNLRNEICKYAVLKHAEPDKIILEIRREIKFIPLIISGVAKVMRRDGKGNGILLHYLAAKQTSAIAITYAIENKNSEIRIKAESNISYIAIPSKVVNSWFEKYKSWRDFYLKENQKQTSLLIEKINNIAFENLEFRVLKYLEYTSLTHKDKTINRKHFDIARDLKVSREAISRVLKKLEKEEMLSLGRNKITLN
ncbi:Crp/Fnr family transcriptional regulator [Lutibacter flavus]|uniref:CRP/FNR family transcriptional regulator, anaerobic regulatory protein n=1 Tax=Lutibacter flavus TaxID=691689 RepID=A0A238XA30_9FLAO|nr:Crp/Fnr family transcriptional regulator [Lutibacter flavus]SNR55797.1 CRP/FNR family transcriptional regulator, anaerobic regulatory protein [Lutibacter flavus]